MWGFFCLFFFCFLVFFFFLLFKTAPVVYGGSQARGRIRATAAGLRHSHSHTRSEPRLQRTPQLTATPDPPPTDQGQGLNPHAHGYQLGLFPLSHSGNSPNVDILSPAHKSFSANHLLLRRMLCLCRVWRKPENPACLPLFW